MEKAEIHWLSEEECIERLRNRARGPNSFLIYSSILQGWTDSHLGLLNPIDDHGFHRGDGVFEAVRFFNAKPYLLREHWDRLQISMKNIDLKFDMTFEQMEHIAMAGAKKFNEKDGIMRLYITRGPGGFAADIRECIAPQFFCVFSKMKPQSVERVTEGVRIGKSAVPVKPGFLATTKSLNYLPNVLMKKESVSRGLDFTVAFENSFVAESATENLVVLTKAGVLSHPKLDRILKGCTMTRLFDLVEKSGILPTNREARLTEQDLIEAQSLMIVGSTLDVLPVKEFEGHAIPVGVMVSKLQALLRHDQPID
jgi:4-amino-4-deoxychorismate lyase